MDPTLDQTAFAILKTGLAPAGIIGNLAASVVWAVGTWIGKPLLDKIPDFAVLFASAGRSNNHDLLRALRRAECQTVVALCDLTLRDQFSVSRDSFTDRLRSWLANRPTSEFRALCHIRRVFSHTYAALEKMPVQQLIEVHGAAVSNVNVLITAGNECVAAMNRNQLREQVVSQQVALLDDMVRAILAQAGVKDQALLSLALSTREQIPSGLRQRIEQHPQGWWELFPLAFREELKDNQRARVAWEMDVLSQLQQQWGDTSTAFEQQMSALDSTLTGIWDDLTRLRHVIDDAIPNMLGLLEGIDDTTRRTEEKVDTLLGQGKRHDPPPLQLPRPAFAGTLFGRAELLAELVARLERREHVDIWGLAGMGKTALAAEAIRAVVGDQRDQLVHTPYPDGVVLLDLYQRKFTSPDPIWHHLADAFDKSLSTALPARERASKACQGRQALVIVEGAEEAKDGSSLQKLLAVLAPETIRLVLTRSKKLISTANPIDVDVALAHDEALALLRTLCPNVQDLSLLDTVHQRLGGHPLALTWAGSQLRKSAGSPRIFVNALQAEQLPTLTEPGYQTHTLPWLYNRSVEQLTPEAKRVLAAAGLLAYQPLPLSMALSVLAKEDGHKLTPDEPAARNALELLVYHGLLRFTDATEEHWEFTHALTHQFSRTTGARELLRVLGDWVIAYYNHAVARVQQTDNFALLGAALNHAVTLLRADCDATELGALQSHLLYDGFDQIDALGRLDFARMAIEAVYDWVQRGRDRQPKDTALHRELAMSALRLGDIEVTAGQLKAAHVAYKQELTIAAQLATQDPHNAQWQRDLSVSHDKVGNVLVAQGQLTEALTVYTASRTIRAQLATQDPYNAQWQHDLAVSYYKLGEVFVQQHKPTEALPYFEIMSTISARLVAQDPSNAIWRNDLIAAEQRMSELQTKRSFWRRLFG